MINNKPRYLMTELALVLRALLAVDTEAVPGKKYRFVVPAEIVAKARKVLKEYDDA